jgi:hypothetical protein
MKKRITEIASFFKESDLKKQDKNYL